MIVVVTMILWSYVVTHVRLICSPNLSRLMMCKCTFHVCKCARPCVKDIIHICTSIMLLKDIYHICTLDLLKYLITMIHTYIHTYIHTHTQNTDQQNRHTHTHTRARAHIHTHCMYIHTGWSYIHCSTGLLG